MLADEVFASLDSLSYVQGKPATSAVLKQQFTDFRVDEQLGFEPSGAGDHLFVHLRKTDLGTTEVARLLADSTGISQRDVGYSGMKDRRGECSQWFSLKLAQDAATETKLQRLESDQLQLLDLQRNNRKLRIGSHRGNQFTLLLRDCVGEPAEFERRLRGLATHGMPNYFGPQRFGRQMSNLQQVTELFQLDGQDNGQTGRRAGGGQRKRGMLYSAARSYLFNQVLSRRIEEDSWDSYIIGDVLNLDGTDRFFAVPPGEWDEVLEQRLRDMDIHLTGLMPGLPKAQDKYATVGQAADIEDAVCQNYPLLLAGLKEHGVQAGRRSLRCAIRDMQWSWPNEGQLQVQFTLPRGAYATSLLRELCVLLEAEGNKPVEAR